DGAPAPCAVANSRTRQEGGRGARSRQPARLCRAGAAPLRGRSGDDRQSRIFRTDVPAGNAAEDPRPASAVHVPRPRPLDRGRWRPERRARRIGHRGRGQRHRGGLGHIRKPRLFGGPPGTAKLSHANESGRAMSVTQAIETRTFEDAGALAQNVAEWLCGLAQASDGRFAVCLSGGSTPRRLYETLATPAFASRLPWHRTHW